MTDKGIRDKDPNYISGRISIFKRYIYFCLHWVFVAVQVLSLVEASGDWGSSLVAVFGFLISAASLVSEHRI